MVEGTVNSTTAYVAQVFRSINREDPRLDSSGQICYLLKEQLKGYKNLDGPKKKQKALPMLVLRKMLSIANNHQDEAMAWLLIRAIFFAMRSCEYLETPNKQKQRTKTVKIGNIVFRFFFKYLFYCYICFMSLLTSSMCNYAFLFALLFSI